jgi:hypothetical protein
MKATGDGFEDNLKEKRKPAPPLYKAGRVENLVEYY